MENDLFILTLRIEQACGSFCKAADAEDLKEELEEAAAHFANLYRDAKPRTREGRKAGFIQQHLAKYKGRLQDRIRELNRIEAEQAEHQAFVQRNAAGDYASREVLRQRDWSQPLNYGTPAYAKDA
jgi:hypothetical protein